MSYEFELVQTVLHCAVTSMKHDTVVEYFNRREIIPSLLEYLIFLFRDEIVHHSCNDLLDLLLLPLKVEFNQLQVLLLVLIQKLPSL